MSAVKSPPPGTSDFSQFDPQRYLADYYTHVGRENAFLLNFLHRTFAALPESCTVLDFGGGPTIYQLLSASNGSRSITYAEFLPQNRQEVNRWLQDPGAGADWDEFLDYVLMLEGHNTNIRERRLLHDRVASKVTEVIECDALSHTILPASHAIALFDVVTSLFCLESITDSEIIFRHSLDKLKRHIKPGGTLIMTLLKNSSHYVVGDCTFPAVPLNEARVREIMREAGLSTKGMESTPADHSQGYEGLMALVAERTRQ